MDIPHIGCPGPHIGSQGPTLGPQVPILDPQVPILGPQVPILGPQVAILGPQGSNFRVPGLGPGPNFGPNLYIGPQFNYGGPGCLYVFIYLFILGPQLFIYLLALWGPY